MPDRDYTKELKEMQDIVINNMKNSQDNQTNRKTEKAVTVKEKLFQSKTGNRRC